MTSMPDEKKEPVTSADANMNAFADNTVGDADNGSTDGSPSQSTRDGVSASDVGNEDNGGGDVSADDAGGRVPFAVRWYVKARTWMATAPGRFRSWASDDNPNKVDRDRKLAFLLTPVFLMIMTGFVSTLVSYTVLFSFMVFGHLSYDAAAVPASEFYNRYLGIPVALVGMALVMFSPAVRDVVKYNGGYHASLKTKDFVADMKASNASQAIARMMVVGVFGGMLVWIIHTLLINGFAMMGFDDIAKDSNTTKNVLDAIQPGAIGFSAMGMANVVFAVFVSPFIEEVVYRGFISRSLVESDFLRNERNGRSAWQVFLICLITGLWFGLGHVTGADSMMKSTFLLCFMTCFGAFLTWLSCVRCKSVWPGILVHVTYNAVSLMPALFA